MYYRENVTLWCGCNVLVAEWFNSFAVGIVQLNMHSNFLEVGTKIEICNNCLLGEGKIESFYLDIDSFHFSIVPVGTLGDNVSR